MLFFYVEGLLAEAEKLCQPCLGIELHGANETSKHTPKRAHPWGGRGGEGRGGDGILYIFFVPILFPWKSGFSSFRKNKHIPSSTR